MARAQYHPGQIVPWDGPGTLLVVPKASTKTGVAFKAVLRGKRVKAQTGKGAISETHDRLTDAKGWLTDIAATLRRGELKAPDHRHTLGGLAEKMQAEVWTGGKTWHGPHLRKLGWWVERLGSDVDVREVTPGELQTAVAWLSEHGGKDGEGYAPKTVGTYVQALGSAFTHAVRWGWLKTSPVSSVTRPSIPRPKYTPPPPLADRLRLVKAARDEDVRLGAFVQLITECGGRRSETMALRWCDVDLSRGVVTFRAETTKSQKTRAVPLAKNSPAVEVLRQLKGGEDQAGYIFPWRQFPFEKWKRARNTAGLPDVKVHTLRKWATSFLAMSGASLRQLVDFLGHANFDQVMIYAHLCENSLDDVAQRSAKKFHHPQQAAPIVPAVSETASKLRALLDSLYTLDAEQLDTLAAALPSIEPAQLAA